MRRLVVVFILLFTSTILVTGCSNMNSKELEHAIETASQYKYTELSVPNYEDVLEIHSIKEQLDRVEPYLTEKCYERHYSNRSIILPQQVAAKKERILKPSDLTMKVKENNGDKLILEYTLQLLFLNEGGQKDTEIALQGELTVINGKYIMMSIISMSFANWFISIKDNVSVLLQRKINLLYDVFSTLKYYRILPK
jgi:hypothetical protein